MSTTDPTTPAIALAVPTVAGSSAMQPSEAYFFGTFVAAAYAMFRAGDLDPATPASFPPGYDIVLHLTAIDRACGRDEAEFFGFVAQATSNPNELVIAIRGTDSLLEWIVDAEFKPVPFSRVPNAGCVEDGFNSVYESLTARTPSGGAADLLGYIRSAGDGAANGASVTIVGHSLGASVGTLLALDVAVHVSVAALSVYTLASPRTGDATFAGCYEARVPTSWRVVNDPDIVPKLPPLYACLNNVFEVDSRTVAVKHSLECYHSLSTYLFLLNPSVPPNSAGCLGASPGSGSSQT